ncbi:MAG: hypothetical protein AAF125_09545 [Chloroflexota bacterium]
MTLEGNGVVLDGNSAVRILENTGGTLTVRNMTIRNAVAASGDGGAIQSAGTLNVESVRFENNEAQAGDGGALSSSGPLSVTTSTFFINSASNRGGAVYITQNSFTPITGTITNSVFSGNIALTDDGAIYSLLDVNLNVSNTKFISNFGGAGNGGIGGDGSFSATMAITNSCFVGNIGAIRTSTPQITSLAGVYWGASNGPSGSGLSGSGDSITGTPPADVGSFNADTSQLPFTCPTVVTDFYSVNLGDTLDITNTADGVLGNDLAVNPNSASVNVGLSLGIFSRFDANGTFTYVAPASAATSVDGFRYAATDLDGDPFVGLSCIVLGDIAINAPGTQTATVGNPLAITPDITVSKAGNTNSTIDQIRVNLTVNQGILNVVDPGNGNGLGIGTPTDDCTAILRQRQIAELFPQTPDVVENGVPSGEIQLMRGRGPLFAPYFQAINVSGPVDVVGNNSNNLTIEGSVADVNIVLSTLTYTANAPGIDNLVIIANDSPTNVAIDNVFIIIGGGASAVNVSNTGGGGDSDDGGGGPVVSIFNGVPLGPGTLAELSSLPNTVIIGEAPGGTVPNGDVFVKVIVVNGQLTADAGTIGDPALLEQSLGNGAELFGLGGGGVPASDFTSSVRVCLRGSGSFNYRDATASPRQTVILPTTDQDGFTCAFIPNAGTIVLVGGAEALTINSGTARELPSDCMVRTLNIVNLREGPGLGEPIIRRIPFDVTLSAFSLQNRYYFVDYLGLRGWISADFAQANDACGIN